MEVNLGGKTVLIIDPHTWWKDGATKVMQQAGMDVQALSRWDPQLVAPLKFDLILFTCHESWVGNQLVEEEMRVLQCLLSLKIPVVVVMLSSRWGSMRELFLLGVFDVWDKVFSPVPLMEMVEESFIRLAAPKSSYQLVEEGAAG